MPANTGNWLIQEPNTHIPNYFFFLDLLSLKMFVIRYKKRFAITNTNKKRYVDS